MTLLVGTWDFLGCFQCGLTRHFRQNWPHLLGKTPFKPEANVSRVGVGVLRNEPALREQSSVASACEQGYSDFGIASLFDCAMQTDMICISRMWIRLSYRITLCLTVY